MLRQAMTALTTNDRKLVGSRRSRALSTVSKKRSSSVSPKRESLDEKDGRRAMEIIAFATNLEHIGDITDKI
jgi:phosphate:Na+ symporter